MCVHMSSCGSFTGCVFDVDVSVSSEVTHPTASAMVALVHPWWMSMTQGMAPSLGRLVVPGVCY